jgi:signal transduction histidine kinase
MKERIESLGGVLVIKSILRKGTLIKAVLPKE